MLELVGDGIWAASHPLKVGGVVAMGARMTVACLADGELFLCAPIPLEEGLQKQVDALGRVRVICAPNKMHHLFVGEWMKTYPEALAIAPPGLAKKRKDLSFQAEWSDAPVKELRGAIEHHLVRGAPQLNEVVFLHKQSRTLILTDFALNFVKRPGDAWGMRLYYALTGAGRGLGQNAVVRSVIKDKAAVRAARDHMLGWDFDKVIVAHGDIVREGGRERLRAATAWLG